MKKTLKDWIRRKYCKSISITSGTLIMLLMSSVGYGSTITLPEEVGTKVEEEVISNKTGLFFFNYFLGTTKNSRNKNKIEVEGTTVPSIPTEPLIPLEPSTPIIIWENGVAIEGISYTTGADILTTGSDGLMTKGGEIINNHIITLSGNNYGMIVNAPEGITLDVSTGINNGTITGSGFGMLATHGTIINKGTITNTGYYGMSAVGSHTSAYNYGEITNNGHWGMYASGAESTVINNRKITNNGFHGMYAQNGALAINDKGAIISNTNDRGMYSLGAGSRVLNNGTISNTGNGGMSSDGVNSVAINNGTISNTGVLGMDAENGGVITNGEKGIIINTSSFGMNSDGVNSVAINNGTISNTGQHGMYAKNGGVITNGEKGIISNDGESGMFTNGNESKAYNYGTVSNKNQNGMIASGLGAQAINYGIISNKGINGMFAHISGVIINEKKGTISNTKDHGMRANDTDALNYGTISNTGSYGMEAFLSKAKAINHGTISNTKDHGMYANHGGTIINLGTIENGGLYGMTATRALSTAVNEVGATINVTKDGTPSKPNYGMGATNGGQIINRGTIKLLGKNQYGMYATGTDSTIKTEKGSVIVLGDASNKAVFVEKGGVIIENSGTIQSTNGVFNTSEQTSGGKLVMGSGGTIEAESIKGDIYASGALTMSGFDDKYDTYKMFKTDKIEGNIISNSTMFDANLTGKDKYGYYGVEMERKNFAEILDNQELAAILENNYVKEQNTTSSSTSKATSAKEDLYGALKLITSSETLGNAVDQTYGEFYSVTGKQTFDMIKSSNRVIRKNVLESDVVLAPGDAIFIGGANYSQLEEDNDDTLQKYNLDLSGVYFGGEKQLTKNMKVGVVATVGKLDIDYDENGTRNDMQYQANTYMKYKSASNVEYTSMFFAGMTTMETERTLAFTSLHEQMESNSENYYLGLHNSMSKKYFSTSGNNTYLKPKAELNFTYLMQGNISESGKYALDIDKSNSLSIETGLGVALGKDIYTKKGKLNLEIGATGYLELGKPYKDLNGKLSVLDGNATIKGYKGNNSYGDVLLGAKYISNSGVSIFADSGYEVGAHNKGWKTSAGISFSF